MNIVSKGRHLFSRQPLSGFSKIVIVTLLVITVFWTALALLVARNTSLLVAAVIVFLIAALVATGIRWAPLLGSLICSFTLYVFVFQSSFPLYHLAHPRDAYNPWWLAYTVFVGILILFWCMLMSIGAGIAAVIQNYRQRQPRTPRWFSPALAGMIGVLLGAILLGAFGPTLGTAPAAATTGGEPTVHLGIGSFLQSSVSVPKGSKLLLVDDGQFEHNLSNGSWMNGQIQPEKQPGAPTVNHLAINGKSVEIGPFTTAGTYHIYCSIHTGMTLTVHVQ
jgi:plastocyanin